MAKARGIGRVMLVYPPITNTKVTNNLLCVPMGLSYLAAVLKDEYDVIGFDAAAEGYEHIEEVSDDLLRYGLSFDDIERKIAEVKPDVVGISCIFSNQIPSVQEIAKRAKKISKEIITITGGTHPSFLPERTLAEGHIDFVIRGEGETAIRMLLKALRDGNDLETVPGIAFRNDAGETRLGPPTEYVKDLDTLPWPALEIFPLQKYFSVNMPMQFIAKRSPSLSFITSRGCPYRCTFCSSVRHWGGRYRTRSPEHVLDEMGHLIKSHGVRELKFEDDNLTFDRDRAKAIFKGMIERGYDLTWNTPNGVAMWSLDDEMLGLMRDSGCFELTLAFESGNERVLDEIIKKPYDLARAPEIVKRIKSFGIETTGYFIIGFPGETMEEIGDTLKLARRVKLDKVYIFIYNPLPGTPLYRKCLDDGLIDESYAFEMDNYFVSRLSSPEWSASELLKISRKEFWQNNLRLAIENPYKFAKKYAFVLRSHPEFIAKGVKGAFSAFSGK